MLGAAHQNWNCRRKPQRKDGEIRKREWCGEVGRSWKRLGGGNSWKVCFIYSVDKQSSSSINNNYSPLTLRPQIGKGLRCGNSNSHTSLQGAWLQKWNSQTPSTHLHLQHEPLAEAVTQNICLVHQPRGQGHTSKAKETWKCHLQPNRDQDKVSFQSTHIDWREGSIPQLVLTPGHGAARNVKFMN